MRTTLGIIICGAAIAACSSTSGNGVTDEGDGGGTHAKDGGATKDGGGTSGSTAGTVSFSGGGGPFKEIYQVVADFGEGSGTPGGGTSPCEAMVDSCQFCAATTGGTKPGTLTLNLLSAGVITIKDNAKTLTTLDYMNPGDAGGYYSYTSETHPSFLWAAGDTLSASAPGQGFPAFSGSIKAPSDVTGITPPLDLTKPVSTSGSQSFTLAWTASSDDASMKVVLGATAGTLSCTADESAGKLVIPASLIAKFASGGEASISLTKTVTTSVPVSGVTMSITASPVAVTGTLGLTK